MYMTRFITPLLIALASLAGTLSVRAESKTAAAAESIPSVFIMPTSPKEGRDPFYPESTRAIESSATTNRTVEISSLKVPGVSGTPGHRFAIINNHTFSVNEEGDVKIPGGTVHIRCLAIQPNYITIEINGQSHRLNVESQ